MECGTAAAAAAAREPVGHVREEEEQANRLAAGHNQPEEKSKGVNPTLDIVGFPLVESSQVRRAEIGGGLANHASDAICRALYGAALGRKAGTDEEGALEGKKDVEKQE